VKPRPIWIGRLLLPAGLFGLALLLRAWLAGGSLPFVEHVDEPAVLEVAIRMVRDGDFSPHIFRYPSLYYDLLAATTKLHVWWGVAAGVYRSDQDIPFKNNGVTSAPLLFIWGRTLTALLGAATVPALLALGRRMFGLRAGLLAALALTVMAYHVRHSHYITVDAPTGLGVVLAILGAWNISRDGHWPGYALAGAALGLAAGTKYNAALAAPAIALAHVIFWRRASLGRPLLRLAACAGLAALAFLITTPFALLDWPTFVSDLRFNAGHYAGAGNGDFVGRWPLAQYAYFFWDEALLAPGCLLLLAGLPALARRFSAQTALLLAATLPMLLLLLSYNIHFTRNTLPILPLCLLLAAAGAVALADLIAARAGRAWAGPAALAALAGALLLSQGYATYQHLAYWSRPHTMVDAAARLRELPQGERIAAELPPTLFGGAVAIFPVARVTDHTLAWYRANGFRYLAANDDLRSPQDQAAYDQIRAAAQPVVVYPPRKAGVQPGPSGAILDLGAHPEQLPFVRRAASFGGQIELLGYEVQPGEPRPRITPLEGADRRALTPGQPVQINLYWRGLAPMGVNYALFIHVVGPDGQRVAQRDLPLRYEDYPSSRWAPGELVIDRADMGLPALPPGDYRLLIGLYDPASGAQLPAANPETELLTLQIR
jgi:4-amino-4-deoxy-L-arabinose transferase-like glycosyltransferase